MQSPLGAALEIVRGLTHSTFTAAKQTELLALLREAKAEASYAASREVDRECNLHPAVAPDEIDEDPPVDFVPDYSEHPQKKSGTK